ncbi:MAG: hypothetical protein LBJ63_11100 [Prevotellaceae bacterium]|jgi:hypothetical protein|nr:hypothetical protein [Prevotellaceae bacterium]
MKKTLVAVAISVIALFAAQNANAIIHPHSHNDGECTIHYTAKDCYCNDCKVKLQSYQKKEQYWVKCNSCGGEGYINCKVWEKCNYCKGTGCANGDVKDGYCVHGHCTRCPRHEGGRDVMKRECECKSCSEYIVENGKKIWGKYECCNYYNVLKCPSCGQEYSGCY